MSFRSLGSYESIRQAGNLPTLDSTATRLLAATSGEAGDAVEVQNILQTDMALAARILKIANSAYYARSRSIQTVDQAVVLLGMDAVRNVAIASSLERMTRGGAIGRHFHTRDLWRHSIATAVHAQAIVEGSRPELKHQAFLAGLLHDLGILLELHLWPDTFADVTDQIEPESSGRSHTYLAAERDLLGAPHTEYGAALLEHWQFPELLVDAIAGHHLDPGTDADRCFLGDVIHVADHVSWCAGAGLYCEIDDTPDAGALERIGQRWDDLRVLADQLRSQVEDIASHFDA